ncbi:hypothetical protein RCL1_001973 [Eukaryota sp. TZLM3-RCL]
MSTLILAILRTLVSGCLSTFAGGVIACLLGSRIRSNKFALSICYSIVAGIMFHIAMDLFFVTKIELGDFSSYSFLFLGVAVFALILKLVPSESFIPSKDNDKSANLRTGFLVFLSITLHNLPEGLVVVTSPSYSTLIAIIFHNLLEGLIASLPLIAASVSLKKVLFLTFLSGFSETLSAVVMLFFTLTHHSMLIVNVVLSGIMLLTSLLLLPDAFNRAKAELVVLFVFLGFGISAITTAIEG